MFKVPTVVLCLALMFAGPAVLARDAARSPATVNSLPPDAPSRPVTIARLIVDYNTGDDWGTLSGPVCGLAKQRLQWEGTDKHEAEMIEEVVSTELTHAGFRLVGDRHDLFQTTEAGDYAVGGVVVHLAADACTPFGISGSPQTFKGSLVMKVEWQIYSRLNREVVAKLTTTGQSKLQKANSDGLAILFRDAFAENLRALINTGEFQKAFVGAARPAGRDLADAGSNSPVNVTAAKGDHVSMSDATGSVVTVITGGGHGSGVLIGSEGYFLTNSHVVGDNKTVRVRFSDGFEVEGEVVRSQRARDVALVKAASHGRAPLAMRAGSLQPGTPIYAIGAPYDQKFSGTVTKGIVSANRIVDGFSFIQSDVTVNPGNSGGPLLDEQGRIVGLTVLSYRPDGVPSGLNMFIPIGDAIDFLGLKLQ